MRYGGLTEEEALKTITYNGAVQLGVEKRVGSIEVGKDADVVIWSGHPLSVYSSAETTFIDGQIFFDKQRDVAMRAALAKERAELEKADGAASTELLHSLFRTVHTIKGSSRAASVQLVEQVTHRIEDLLAPMPFLKLTPTGGVDLKTAADWIKAGAVMVGAGSSLVSKDALAKGDWAGISATAKQFVEIVKGARAK